MCRNTFALFAALLIGLPAAAARGRRDLTMIIVYDNNPFNRELATRWGFACLVRGTEKTILFDTGGDDKVLLANITELGLSPKGVDVVVLSHIHGDHTGGLAGFLRANNKVTVYLPRSFPKRMKNSVKDAGAKAVEVLKPTEVCKDVYSTGELGRAVKEQALVIKTAKGLVVVTGCAHPGVVNMVKRAREMVREDVHLVIGGFHLGGTSAQRIREILAELRRENVRKVAPVHCTGELARKLFKEEYGDDCILGGVGTTIEIKDALPSSGEQK